MRLRGCIDAYHTSLIGRFEGIQIAVVYYEAYLVTQKNTYSQRMKKKPKKHIRHAQHFSLHHIPQNVFILRIEIPYRGHNAACGFTLQKMATSKMYAENANKGYGPLITWFVWQTME